MGKKRTRQKLRESAGLLVASLRGHTDNDEDRVSACTTMRGHLMRRCYLLVLSAVWALLASALPAADFQPDPRSVQRYGPAYRYPQAGWIVLHIEGEPYQRGCQHGRLLAPEIAAHVRCMAAVQGPRSPSEAWKHTRTLANALFLRRYERELLEEMKGIADGASAAGARFDNRPIDLVDIVALNSWPEIETLPAALDATPTGLEGMRFAEDAPKPTPAIKPMHCSAFAATGPATADGKVVIGHITMFGLYPSAFYNVWLDVKPKKGHRVFMQSYPGGVQSGMDYYFNDAGIVVCETTIAQTRFDGTGMAVASRIRQALQYADTIDGVVDVLRKNNNGLYTNEWLLADCKTNEIAMFELGTRKSKLYRSSKKEWVGGTEGFYWGCNNTKDLQVRLETVASVEDRPAVAVFRPSERDIAWLRLYDAYKGKIDASFGKLAFTTPPLAAYHSVDAKYTTTELALQLKTHAIFGPPLGRTWKPTFEERQSFPEVQALVSNPWTVLHGAAPSQSKDKEEVADLHDPTKSNFAEGSPAAPTPTRRRRRMPPTTLPAWHGTLLPATDADIWLATGFANYERIVAMENQLRKESHNGKLSTEDRQKIGLALFAHRADYELGARAHPEKPLDETRSDDRHNDWYRVAAGKGTLLLHSMRQEMGHDKFVEVMDRFGRAHAGQKAEAREFYKVINEASKDYISPTAWLRKTGLAELRLEEAEPYRQGKGYEVAVKVRRLRNGRVSPIEVTVETVKGEATRELEFGLDSFTARLVIPTKDEPRRVVVDKYGLTPRSNGGPFSVVTFAEELEDTLIVYGTADEFYTNREAARALQQALLERGPNITVRVKDDLSVGDDVLKERHVILIGRPDSNRLVARFQKDLPITFGRRSFEVGGKTFAHAGSAVIVAAENPLNRRYSLVVVAGLDAASTWRTAPRLADPMQQPAEAVVFPHAGTPRRLVLSARDLVREVAVGRNERASR
jgi:hypothetical protein